LIWQKRLRLFRKMSIKLFQNNRIWSSIGNEITDLANSMHARGYAQNSPLMLMLEQQLAQHFGRKHCITTGCGTDALDIAIQSIELPLQSTVAVSNYTFTASAHAIKRAGHNVVAVDVDQNYCIDPDKIPGSAAAVVAVDLFGNMSQHQRLQQAGVPIIVDAAQSLESIAHGKFSAQHGLLSCLSFSPSKTVSSWGSGGAVLTDSDELAARCQKLRLHGKTNNNADAIAPGLNSMMSSFEVAAVIVGLKYSPQWQQRRTKIAQYLCDRSVHQCANDFGLDQNTFSKLVFQSDHKDLVVNQFKDLNIDCVVHYNRLVADETIYASNNDLLNSKRLQDISFTVPNQHTLTDSEVETIAKALT